MLVLSSAPHTCKPTEHILARAAPARAYSPQSASTTNRKSETWEPQHTYAFCPREILPEPEACTSPLMLQHRLSSHHWPTLPGPRRALSTAPVATHTLPGRGPPATVLNAKIVKPWRGAHHARFHRISYLIINHNHTPRFQVSCNQTDSSCTIPGPERSAHRTRAELSSYS